MSTLLVTTILFLLFFSGILHSAQCADPEESDDKVISNMKKVKDKIFKNYDKEVRPESHHNHTTTVYFDILPGYVIELDEERSLFSLDSWFLLHWKDKRLQWNRSEFDDLTHITVADHHIWQPDIRIYNAHSSNIDPKTNTHLVVDSDGYIWWVPPATVTTFCDVTTPTGSYPRDTHQCNITVGSWTHNGWQLDIKIFKRGMYWDIFSNTNPRWEVDTENTKVYRIVTKYECCEEPYISVHFNFVLKRRSPSHMKVVFVPSILVMMLTLSMFWIPSDSTKKITLGVSLLIILTALTIYCAALTRSPRTQHLAVSFVQATMISVTVAVFLETIIINLARINSARRPPEFLVGVMSGSLGKYVCIWAPWKESIPGDKVRLQEDSEPVNTEPTPKEEWLVVATGFDRILFVVYIIIFAAIHQV